jgi:hypothetical protein
MEAKVNKAKDTVTLKMTVEEALSLEGVLAGPIAREIPWYDEIADALEASGVLGNDTIYAAVERRFHFFNVVPAYSDESGRMVPDEFRPIRRITYS